LSAVAIRNNAGQYVSPNDQTIGDGTYNPLARRIYMNLLDDESALDHTIPFVKFGLENPYMVGATGYVPIPEDQAAEIIVTRLSGTVSGGGDSGGDDSSKLSTGAIVGIAIGGAVFLLCVVVIAIKCMRSGGDKEGNAEQAL
jgi:hypothetical protein